MLLKVKLKLPPAVGEPEVKRPVSDVTSWVPVHAQLTLVPAVTVKTFGDQVKPTSTMSAANKVPCIERARNKTSQIRFDIFPTLSR